VNMERLLEILQDDCLADHIAEDCHDPAHLAPCCPTCEARADGIDAYRAQVLKMVDGAERHGGDKRFRNWLRSLPDCPFKG